MKTFLVTGLACLLFTAGNAQPARVVLSSKLKDLAFPAGHCNSSCNTSSILKALPGNHAHEDTLGVTEYDLQSNASGPSGRFTGFPDGTLSAVWTLGNQPTSYPDRGTGYNYFDGASWKAWPTTRVENFRTGWPSIARLGTEGEVIVAHRSFTTGLVMNRSTLKGTGDWNESAIPLPSDVTGLAWSRLVSSGSEHNQLHIMSMTTPVINGGSLFKGMDGALLYYRSVDGGNSWTDQGIQLPGMDSSAYKGFSSDCYAFAEPEGNRLAFIYGDRWTDLFVMISEDNGQNWQKHLIWQHPYPHWNGENTDTLYCPDGAVHCAFDANGLLHAVFGITRCYYRNGEEYRFPFVDGIGYWNENLPSWTGGDQKNCLNPDLLYSQGNLAGWMQDVNHNGILDLEAIATNYYADYNVGPSSFPQLQFDDQNRGLLVFSSLTEGYSYHGLDFRHMWVRRISNDGSFLTFQDLQEDPVLGFRECIYPTLNPYSDADSWHLIFQQDRSPELQSSQQNYIAYTRVSKFNVGLAEQTSGSSIMARPNPCREIAGFDFVLPGEETAGLEIVNIQGETVLTKSPAKYSKGPHTLKLDISSLPAGVYLYLFKTEKRVLAGKLTVI